MAVSRLRRKLRQYAGARDCIKCQRHVGYQLGIAVTLVNLDAGLPSRGPEADPWFRPRGACVGALSRTIFAG